MCDVYTPIDVPAGERYPAEIDWLRRVHADGALIASVCSGSLILAHSGLLDRLEATGHWAYRQLARQHYPRVRWREESVLARAGDGQRIVTAGGVTALAGPGAASDQPLLRPRARSADGEGASVGAAHGRANAVCRADPACPAD